MKLRAVSKSPACASRPGVRRPSAAFSRSNAQRSNNRKLHHTTGACPNAIGLERGLCAKRQPQHIERLCDITPVSRGRFCEAAAAGPAQRDTAALRGRVRPAPTPTRQPCPACFRRREITQCDGCCGFANGSTTRKKL